MKLRAAGHDGVKRVAHGLGHAAGLPVRLE
jgi:hypothetical protein